MSRTTRFLFVLALAATWLTGCAPPPVNDHLPPTPTGDRVAALLSASLGQIETLNAQGVLKLREDDKTRVTEINLAYDRDQGMRLDVMAPFGLPLLTTIQRPDRLILLDYGRRLRLEGPVTRAAAENLLRFSIEPHMLPELLLGGITHKQQPWQVSPPPRDAGQAAWWHYTSGAWTVAIDPASERPRRLHIAQPEALEVTWDDWQTIDTIPVAHRIGLQRPDNGQGLILKLSHVKLNCSSFDAKLFFPPLPEGWQTRQVSLPN